MIETWNLYDPFVASEMVSQAIVRNIILYVIGVALLVAGALGMVDAIALHVWIATLSFISGLVIVIVVHHLLEGPF